VRFASGNLSTKKQNFLAANYSAGSQTTKTQIDAKPPKQSRIRLFREQKKASTIMFGYFAFQERRVLSSVVEQQAAVL
jgi:hypothetical protein